MFDHPCVCSGLNIHNFVCGSVCIYVCHCISISRGHGSCGQIWSHFWPLSIILYYWLLKVTSLSLDISNISKFTHLHLWSLVYNLRMHQYYASVTVRHGRVHNKFFGVIILAGKKYFRRVQLPSFQARRQ